MVQSYEGMVKEDSDMTVWNRAFETLAEIVEYGRKKYGDFAPELFILDGSRKRSRNSWKKYAENF